MENFEFCILKDEKDIIEYEKGLYKAFYLKDPNGWVAKNYILKNERLKSKISYSTQSIYAIKNQNKNIIGAIAINFNILTLQLNDMGFNILEKDINSNTAEGINFFILEDDKGETFFSLLGELILFATKDLDNKNIKVLYITSSIATRNLYSLYGFDEIDKKIIDGVEKYLFRGER